MCQLSRSFRLKFCHPLLGEMAIRRLNTAHGSSATLILGPEIFGFEREATRFEGAHRSEDSLLGFMGEVRAAGVTG